MLSLPHYSYCTSTHLAFGSLVPLTGTTSMALLSGGSRKTPPSPKHICPLYCVRTHRARRGDRGNSLSFRDILFLGLDTL